MKVKVVRNFLLLCLVALLAISIPCGRTSMFAHAESFVPTWKLLKNDEKRQFVAGYMYGWRDAAKVIDIAKDFVKQNPSDALSGLDKVKTLYDLSGLKVDTVVRDLDTFFTNPENRDATFSQAITSIRSR